MIEVTRPSLPELDEYIDYLRRIWQSKWVTNHGQFELLLEKKLRLFLRTKEIVLVSNGTVALQLALRAFNLKGEIVTTPYTFIATTNAIRWEGLTPVFADIDIETFNIDPEEVRKKVTNKTSAILAVHVYGNPCEVKVLEEIASENNIALIYDGAHSFGVEYGNRSVFTYGDMSTLSFHATKVFNTIEGGAIVTENRRLSEKIRLMSNHGIKSEDKIACIGTNAKMNEFQAAMGLCNLKRVNRYIECRKRICELYKERLGIFGEIEFQKIVASKYNYAYMPVLFKNLATRERVWRKLEESGIHSKRYFYPLTVCMANSPYGTLKMLKKHLPRALSVSERVLCLPLYPELTERDVDRISGLIGDVLNNSIG